MDGPELVHPPRSSIPTGPSSHSGAGRHAPYVCPCRPSAFSSPARRCRSFVGRRRRRRRRCASSPRRRRSPRHMHRIVVAAVATPRLAPVMVAVVVAAPAVAPRLLSVRQASSTKNVTKTTLSGQSRATTINPRTRRCVALPVVRSSAARYPARSQVAGLSSRRRAHLAACSALSSRRPPVWPAS